jgi:hypothetical protein
MQALQRVLFSMKWLEAGFRLWAVGAGHHLELKAHRLVF